MRGNNLIRMLMMFGPMIYNGVTRFLNSRKQKQNMAPKQRTAERENDRYDDREPEAKKPNYKEDDMV